MSVHLHVFTGLYLFWKLPVNILVNHWPQYLVWEAASSQQSTNGWGGMEGRLVRKYSHGWRTLQNPLQEQR